MKIFIHDYSYFIYNMNIDIFEKKINDVVLQYGSKRSIELDENLFIDNQQKKNIFEIPDENRFKLNCNVYSIDPVQCEDADDAFSILKSEDGNITLVIHIADPTDFISLDSELWKDCLKRGVTYYPSNKQPIHMLPKKIMEKASLMTLKLKEVKKSISLFVDINKETYLPIDESINIKFCNILLKKENAYSYDKAGDILTNNKYKNTNIRSDLLIGMKIADAIYNQNDSVGKLLNNKPVTNINYQKKVPTFETDSYQVFKVKRMIAQFAIYANSFVGKYLYENLNDSGLFRTCDAKKLVDVSENILNDIVSKGIHAEYQAKSASHDLIGIEKYSHFTSPLRRLSDMVVHYLIKYLNLRDECNNNTIGLPFDSVILKEIADKNQMINKKIKNLAHKESKLRFLQIMYNLIQQKGFIDVEILFNSYIKDRFLNFMIRKIDNFDCYISLTFKKNRFPFDYTKSKDVFKYRIQVMKPKEHFDNKMFPNLFYSLIGHFIIQ